MFLCACECVEQFGEEFNKNNGEKKNKRKYFVGAYKSDYARTMNIFEPRQIHLHISFTYELIWKNSVWGLKNHFQLIYMHVKTHKNCVDLQSLAHSFSFVFLLNLFRFFP